MRYTILGLCLVAAQAIAEENCEMTDGQDNCVRILACIGSDGRWFDGRAYGRGEGVLGGKISNGPTCKGTWTARNALMLGQADVTCDDGMTVTVFYTYQDEYTGTAIGRGISNRREIVKAWSGLHVLEYLSRTTGLPRGRLLCGISEIPIS